MNRPQPIPVNALFGSDAVTQLVLVMSDDTIAQAAEKIAYHSVGRRVARQDAPMELYCDGRLVPPASTVEEAGITARQFVYVDYGPALAGDAAAEAATAPRRATAGRSPDPPAIEPGPRRRRRTWSGFGELGRLPSEYEVVTHDVNYTLRKGRSAALEANSSSPANLWFLTWRDRSPLQAGDWNGFRDPDELTYRRYVTLQDEQEAVVRGILDRYSEAGHDGRLAPGWVAALAALFTPARRPAHAVQMCHAYVGQMAPSSYISNCSVFAAGDMLRRLNLLAYRTRELQRAHPDAGFGTADRARWEREPGWQGVRHALEEALATYDWGESFVAVNLVLRPTLDDVLLRALGDVARDNGDELTWLLLANLDVDAERCRRWSAALARYAVDQEPANAAVMRGWAERWAPAADAAANGLAEFLESLPEAGRSAARTVAEARRARQRLLAVVT